MSQPVLPTGVRFRLSAMMFLQYAFNGIWIIPLGAYLGKVGFTVWLFRCTHSDEYDLGILYTLL